MKKIIAITAMAAMVAAAAMADEPDVDLKIAEISGNASVTWGVDLGAPGVGGGRTGFKNGVDAKLKVNIANGGSKLTEGEGVWGELEVKVGDALVAEQGEIKGGKAAIETAKLHIGDLYIGIKSGDAQVGGLNLPNAIRSDKAGVDAKGQKDVTEGVVIGYGNDLFGIDVDFRSAPDSTKKDYYTDDYALAAEAQLKDLAGFSAKAGASYAIKSKTLGLFGTAAYKLALGDNYLKVTAGAGFDKVGSGSLGNGQLGASVVFGWGDEADANAGVYYLDNDEAKKVTPGVGVAVNVPLYKKTVIDIVPSFYSGEIIPNLTAAVVGDIELPVGIDNANMGIGLAAGVSYKLAVGDAITITPKAGFRFANENYTTVGKASSIIYKANTDNSGLDDWTKDDAGLINVKAGVEVGGLIPNTTFTAEYQSRNFKAAEGGAGTFNITAKIAL